VNGLQNLRRPEDVAKTRGLRIKDVLPVPKQVDEEEQVAEPDAAPAAEPATEAPAAAAEEPETVVEKVEEPAAEGEKKPRSRKKS
jgi:hypothetical protein